MNIYIHTLGDKPAMFDGRQIVFASRRVGGRGPSVAYSLVQIRDEQRQSAEWRKKKGFTPTSYPVGYVRFRVEDSHK